jgi:anhydro-N-acetylmuramic acid kinase
MGEGRTLYVGAISGTSMDGLDLALIDIAGDRPTVLAGTTVAFDPMLRELLMAVASGQRDDLDHVATADHLLGRFTAEQVLAFLASIGRDPGDVAGIGSHGQTVRHRPHGSAPYTWQIGDPNLIAELTGITTVADFRRRDLAAGGEAAPLVPPFHDAVFRHPGMPVTVVNVGGIGNITILSNDPTRPLAGFDTGPGNALLDAWISRHRGERYDRNGAWAKSGKVDAELLAHLLEDPYFDRPPPKSTGKEHFNAAWLDARVTAPNGREADIQATLTVLTARTIADAIVRWGSAHGRVIVCGGGRLNGCLMHHLATALPQYDVVTSDAVGVDGDCLEAAAFAWLAAQTLHRRPGNAPSVTGARGPRVLGGVYPGG